MAHTVLCPPHGSRSRAGVSAQRLLLGIIETSIYKLKPCIRVFEAHLNREYTRERGRGGFYPLMLTFVFSIPDFSVLRNCSSI